MKPLPSRSADLRGHSLPSSDNGQDDDFYQDGDDYYDTELDQGPQSTFLRAQVFNVHANVEAMPLSLLFLLGITEHLVTPCLLVPSANIFL